MNYKQRLDYMATMIAQSVLNSDDNGENLFVSGDEDTTWSEDLANFSVDVAKAIIKRVDKEIEE